MTFINRQVEAELFEGRETVTTNGDCPQGIKSLRRSSRYEVGLIVFKAASISV